MVLLPTMLMSADLTSQVATVDGTQTLIQVLLILQIRLLGIASTTAATDATADGAGIEICQVHL